MDAIFLILVLACAQSIVSSVLLNYTFSGSTYFYPLTNNTCPCDFCLRLSATICAYVLELTTNGANPFLADNLSNWSYMIFFE